MFNPCRSSTAIFGKLINVSAALRNEQHSFLLSNWFVFFFVQLHKHWSVYYAGILRTIQYSLSIAKARH